MIVETLYLFFRGFFWTLLVIGAPLVHIKHLIDHLYGDD